MNGKRIAALIPLLLALLLPGGCGGQPQSTEESTMKGHWESITQEEARERMKRQDGHLIVDVRRKDEYEAGHIPGAIRVTNEEIGTEQPAELPDLDRILLIYCRSGRRSREAAEKLARIGYTHIYEFGGILEWTGATVTGGEPGTDPADSPETLTAPAPSTSNCTAVLTFDSFDGGGPEYEFVTDEPDVITWETVKEYARADHADLDGAAYTVTVTVRALKEGSATFTVMARSPIADNYDAAYYVTVDGVLNVTVSGPVVYEVINGTRATDEVIRPAPELVIEANGRVLYAHLEDNPSAKAFLEILSHEGVVEVAMHDYSNFEKTGPLPWSLPRGDEDLTTVPGDVILYQGSQICIYYDTNRYSLTRLARIGSATREELLEIFGSGDVTVTFHVEWGE